MGFFGFQGSRLVFMIRGGFLWLFMALGCFLWFMFPDQFFMVPGKFFMIPGGFL